MKIRNTAAVLLSLLLLIGAAVSGAYAGSMTVVKDNGTNNQYSKLPTNYVQITHLDFGRASFEGTHTGYTLEQGYVGTTGGDSAMRLVYNGKLSYGGNHMTSEKNASLKTNSLPNVTLRFPNAAKKAGESAANYDVLMTFSSVKVGLTESYNTSITDSTNVKLPIAGKNGVLYVTSPRTSLASAYYDSTNKSTGAGVCTTMDITMKIVTHGTNTAITGAPSMLIMFMDLDVADKSVRKDASAADRWNGKYSEGVELLTGWQNPVVLAPDSNSLANTCLVEAQTTSAGNTKIKGKGSVMQNYMDTFDAIAGDSSSLYSGMIAAVDPASFSFRWTGSVAGGREATGNMGTSIGGQPTVAVKAKRTGAGASAATLGNSSAKSGVDTWYNNTHLMNSSSTYNFAPGEGYFVKSLKLDGETLELTEDEIANGGSYTFERLNKYPLPTRDIRNGQVFYTKESGYYTLEAEFGRLPGYRDNKVADRKYVKLGSDEEITYTLVSTEVYEDAVAGTHELHDDLANGLLHIVPDSMEVTARNGSFDIQKADDSGIDILFHSDAGSGTGSGSGELPQIYVSYRATVNWDAYYAAEDVSITNTFNDQTVDVYPTADIRITKEVAGNLRDTTKKFEFEVTLTGLEESGEYALNSISGGALKEVSNGFRTGNGFRSDEDGSASLVFELTGEQGAEILDLPIGTGYRITERKSDHRASYRLETDAEDPVLVKTEDENEANWTELSTADETIDKTDGIVTAAFTNTRESAPRTGILSHTDWMFACLAIIAAAGMIAVRIRRKGNE